MNKEIAAKGDSLIMEMRLKIFDNLVTDTDVTEAATQCAIIAVEEIIKSIPLFPSDGKKRTLIRMEQAKNFWNEVLNYLKSKL